MKMSREHWTQEEIKKQLVIDRKNLCSQIYLDKSYLYYQRTRCDQTLHLAEKNLSASINALDKFDSEQSGEK